MGVAHPLSYPPAADVAAVPATSRAVAAGDAGTQGFAPSPGHMLRLRAIAAGGGHSGNDVAEDSSPRGSTSQLPAACTAAQCRCGV